MTEQLPPLGVDDADDRRALGRRQLLRAGVWAAPVLVLATPGPAMAAAQSITPASGGPNVPASATAVDAYSIYNLNAGGTPGPIGWAGGHIGYWNPVNSIAVATLSYVVLVTRPDGQTMTVESGMCNVVSGQSFRISEREIVQKPLTAGTYTLTLSVTGSGGTTSSDITSLTV